MGFLNETNVSDADFAEYVGELLNPYFPSPVTHTPRWTIDRERKIVLIFMGGGVGPFPRRYGLIWNGEVIIFEGWQRRHRDAQVPTALAVDNRIESVFLTAATMNRREEILALIREAMYAYGDLGTLENVLTVTVEIEPNLAWYVPNSEPKNSWSKEK